MELLNGWKESENQRYLCGGEQGRGIGDGDQEKENGDAPTQGKNNRKKINKVQQGQRCR